MVLVGTIMFMVGATLGVVITKARWKKYQNEVELAMAKALTLTQEMQKKLVANNLWPETLRGRSQEP